MKKLILLRHAKSDWDDPRLTDFDRPLNNRGANEAPKIGKWILKFHSPDFALISSAKRTTETFEHTGIKCDHELQKALYLADQHILLRAVQQAQNDVGTLLLIAHNPGITDLVNLFLNSNEGYLDLKTANAAVFEFNCETWSNISRKNGELIDFASGKKLK